MPATGSDGGSTVPATGSSRRHISTRLVGLGSSTMPATGLCR